MTTLILASGSHTRAQLLRAAGVPFEVEPAAVDEEGLKESFLAEGASPSLIADALAELKAIRISARYPEALVLGADQVLEFRGDLISKCGDLAAASELLRCLRGQSHSLLTAAVLAKAGAPIWRHLGRATLTMRDFSDEFLAAYIAAEGEALLTGVGCYRLEAHGLQLFSRIDGDYFAILGLPMLALLTALRDQGIIAR